MNEEITQQDDEIKENGQASLIHNPEKHRIHLFTCYKPAAAIVPPALPLLR